MDQPIDGDKYVRTLSHYFRHNHKRLVPIDPSSTNDNNNNSNNTNNGNGNSNSNGNGSGSGSGKNTKSTSPMSHGVRSFITPADPMAAAYSGMVNSLWSVGSAVVDVVATTAHFGSDKHGAATTPAEGQVLKPGVSSAAQDRDSFHGAWDGTGTILSDSSPRERQLYLQAQLKAPIFPMDLYYLLYLLDRFELEGINIEGWDGSTPRAVGDSKPRVLNNGTGLPDPSTYSSFPPPTTTRPQSIRSFSSTALSTLTLITGWKQWSTAASSSSSSNNAMTIADDVHFIHKFLKKITGLRLVSKIPPGFDVPGKGRIEGYSGEGISSLLRVLQPDQDSIIFRQSPPPQLLLPLGATFSSLTHLELHKIPPRSIDGWECLMPQLKSLVVIQSGIEDVHDVIVTAVVESERRRRERVSKEKNRAVLIRQEQREAFKDATMTSRSRRMGQGSTSSTSQSPESSQASSPSSLSQSGGTMFGSDFANDDDLAILNSIKMWPVLRHLSVSDNALATLQNNDTFSYTQAIVTLDLSNNLLVSPPPNLIHLHNLHNLNLSYNLMTNVQAIYQILGNVTELDLRGNRLESLCGLERLWNLEKVDVRENNLAEAAEIGRLAALPGIREVWSEMNPFCTIQPKYRLEILAVFKANGHDLLLDGAFASFIEKRTLANMSPTSFSTTISSIVNLANIPAASAPSAVLAKELASPPPRITRPDTATTGSGAGSSERADSTDRRSSSTRSRDNSLIATPPPGSRPSSQPQKLVKKKLVKSSKRVKRIVNLDSDHEHDEDGNSVEEDGDEQSHDHHHHHDEDAAYSKVLGPPVTIGKKKVIKKKPATTESGVGATATEGGAEEKKTKKKVVKKKKNQGPVSSANNNDENNNTTTTNNSNNNNTTADDETNCLDKRCKDNRHVHRLALLEESMNGVQLHNNTNSNSNHNHSARHPHHDSHSHNNDHGHTHNHHNHNHHHDNDSNSHGSIHHHHGDTNSLRAPSPLLDYSSSDDGGAEGYRRKIEAIRNEAGPNWLKVWAEMGGDNETQQPQVAYRNSSSIGV